MYFIYLFIYLFIYFLKKTSTFCFKKTPTIQTDPMTIWLVKVQVYHTSFNAPLGLEKKKEVEGIPKLSTRNNTKYMPIFTDHAYEGLDGGSWYSLITKNIAIYSLSLKFWLIH